MLYTMYMDPVSQIKQSLDILDVVGAYVSLKKSGKSYKGLCPFHSEDTPSFIVSPEIQIYKCFGCGEAGDIFSFIEKIEGVDFPRALEILADRAGITIEKNYSDPNKEQKKVIYKINTLTAKFYNYLLTKHPVGRTALDYLHEKRKIKDVMIKEFMLGFAPSRWDILYNFLIKKGYSAQDLLSSGVVIKKSSGQGYIDKLRGRVVFPLFSEDDKIVGFTGRDIIGRDPKYLHNSETLVFNKSTFLYGLNKSKLGIKKSGAIFVEGTFDVINSYQNKIDNVVASLGTALTQLQLKLISRYTKDIYFCFDSDTAGRSAIIRALEIADQMELNTHVISIPENYKDLDELVSGDIDLARQVIKHPVPIYDFYMADAFKKFDKSTAYGKKQIVNYLMPVYSRIKNSVVADHYIKKLSDELQIREESLRTGLPQSGKFTNHPKLDSKKEYQLEKTKKSSEEYLIALILKLSLDTMGSFLYKLESSDFQKHTNKDVFNRLTEYTNGIHDKFDIKYFIEDFSEEVKNYILELYLWDLVDLEADKSLFEKELNATILRIKQDTIKRELKNISDQIKLAELRGGNGSLEELTGRFNELSKKLI